MSTLEQKSTNPIRTTEMDAEKGKKKDTFKKWQNIISRIMGQFMFLEAFASGLLGTKSKATCDILITRSTEVFEQMNGWKEEYKKDEQYWEEMKGWLGNWLNQHGLLSNAQKADLIKKKLEDYLTRDAHYIAVYDHYHNNTHYWANDKAPGEQFINCFGYGGGNAFVYRSKQANQVETGKLEEMRVKVQSFKNGNFRDNILQSLGGDPIPDD